MKNLIYEKPLLFLTAIDLFFLLAFIVLIKQNTPILLPVLAFVVSLFNNETLKKGKNLTKKNKIIFISLFSIFMIVVVTYSIYKLT